METDFFDCTTLAEILRTCIRQRPKRGRGLVKDLALTLNVASPQVSQFLSGQKVPTFDQALQIARFFHWSEMETEFFLVLVESERSGRHESRVYLGKKLERLRGQSQQLRRAIPDAQELSEAVKARFYSSWIYSAVRLFCSLDNGKTKLEIYEYFPERSPAELDEVVEFLLAAQLIKQQQGHYQLGVTRTFVSNDSPFLRSHHCNWRLRAVEKAGFISEDEMMFTAPISISKKGFKKVRRDLKNIIEQISKELASHGEAEEVVCLNIDFFRMKGT